MSHHAYYDTEGNIIIPMQEMRKEAEQKKMEEPQKKIEERLILRTPKEHFLPKERSSTFLVDEKMLREVQQHMRGMMFGAMTEGLRQNGSPGFSYHWFVNRKFPRSATACAVGFVT